MIVRSMRDRPADRRASHGVHATRTLACGRRTPDEAPGKHDHGLFVRSSNAKGVLSSTGPASGLPHRRELGQALVLVVAFVDADLAEFVGERFRAAAVVGRQIVRSGAPPTYGCLCGPRRGITR